MPKVKVIKFKTSALMPINFLPSRVYRKFKWFLFSCFFSGCTLQVAVIGLDDPHSTFTRDPSFIENQKFKMMKARNMRSLQTGSPRMSRSKVLPISTAHSRKSLQYDIKSDPSQFLEVTPITATEHSAQSRRHVKYENTYKLAPDQPFIAHEIEKAAEKILTDNLHDKYYDPVQCKTLSQLLSSRILEEVKRMGYTRYKMVAIVSIGSIKERPGVQLGSRCLWNKETDNFISAKYSNKSIFAVAMVYGLYYD